MVHRFIPFLLLLALPACGISIEASAPLVYVAPLEGDWVLETDASTELRVRSPGGQPLYDPQFTFAADLVTPGGTTSYDGEVDERAVTLRDPGTGAVLLTGELVDNTMLRLSDGRTFAKPFTPEFLGYWQDVNRDERYYFITNQTRAITGTAIGCAESVLEADGRDLEGVVDVQFSGDEISVWRVEEGGVVALRAPGYFFGYSAIRIKRIDGYIHLQRVDRAAACP